MYCLGQIKSLGHDGKLVVKGEFAPKLESKVKDNSMKIIGTVKRVFGPVDSPYISIQPRKNSRPSLNMIGKEVYVKEKPE